MRRALRMISMATLAFMSASTTGAEESDPTWNHFLERTSFNDIGHDIAVHPCGNTFNVIGTACSWDFPTTSGAFDVTNDGQDVFVMKFNSTGSELIFSTFLGGGDFDEGYSVAMDNSGCVYITGETWSRNFPVTDSAFDVTYNINTDAFLSKLNVNGNALVYSTFLGGQ